ncbi:MAG: hypothetical protein ACTS27_05865 [Phycisphaerales bacterium]
MRCFPLIMAFLCAAAFAQPETVDLREAKDRAADLLEERKFEEARPILEQIVAIDPSDHVSLYNLACVRLSDGDRAGAEESLRRAIGVGFVDFHQLLRDPDLAGLRGTDTVRLIERDWARVLDLRGEADATAALDALGPNYTHIEDPDLRVHILSSFSEDVTRAAHEELRLVAEFVDENLFGIDAPADRPDPWALVILPTREHFARFVPFSNVGGVYDHDQRRLVSRDLGPSLRHEFVHVLHHRRMMRLGQQHAFWLQEGIASLVERVTLNGDPSPQPTWRINIARRLAEPRRLQPWERLFSLDAQRFVSVRPLAMYAQAYAAALWLYDRGALRGWIEAYEAGFDEEPTGVAAFEKALGADGRTLERAWRDWLVAQPFVAESFEDGASSLGVDLADLGAEGPTVQGIFARSADGLRLRDVVRTVGGAPTRTVAEAVQVLSDLPAGRRVDVEVRRGRLELTVSVAVVAFDEDASRGLAERLGGQ